jgi:hypothetical protein
MDSHVVESSDTNTTGALPQANALANPAAQDAIASQKAPEETPAVFQSQTADAEPQPHHDDNSSTDGSTRLEVSL